MISKNINDERLNSLEKSLENLLKEYQEIDSIELPTEKKLLEEFMRKKNGLKSRIGYIEGLIKDPSCKFPEPSNASKRSKQAKENLKNYMNNLNPERMSTQANKQTTSLEDEIPDFETDDTTFKRLQSTIAKQKRQVLSNPYPLKLPSGQNCDICSAKLPKRGTKKWKDHLAACSARFVNA